MQQQYIQQQSAGLQDGLGSGSGKYGASALHSKRGTGDYHHSNSLGRMPAGSSGLQPGIRRTASGNHGIQGGVLSGVTSSQSGDGPSSRGGSMAAGEVGLRGERGLAGRSARYGQRAGGIDGGDQPPPPAQATTKSGGGPAWTSNRWRHLQPEDDSSGNSSPTEDAGEAWSAGPASTEWKPSSGSDPIQQERARIRSADTSLQDWDEDDKAEATPVPAARKVDSPVSIEQPPVSSSRPSMPTSSSNRSFLMDDLLGPSRIAPTAIAESHSLPSAPLSNGFSAPSSRSNSITTPLSMLNIGAHDPLLSASGRGIRLPAGGGNTTPSRAAAAEGLELLARRSPVQEVSMAALQQQYMPRTQPNPPPIRQLPPEQIFWQYRDPSGQLQGPFSALQMQDWYRQGFFNDTLLVKRVESTDFENLGALIMRVGDVSQPFLSPLAPRVMALPPGMVGFGQSPVAQRAVSPALWRSHAHDSQPTSREGSFSSPLTSAYPQDPFTQIPSQHQQFQSTSSYSAPRADLVESETQPLDPWADTALVSQPIRRGSSALGGGDAVVAADISAHKRTLAVQQAAIGPISPIVGNPLKQQEALPSPIGRVSAIAPPLESASPIQQAVQPSAPKVAAIPAESNPEPAAPALPNKADKAAAPIAAEVRSALPSKKPEQMQAAASKPEPSEAEPQTGRVSTVTQEAFQRQKKSETALAPATNEVPFSSFVNDLSPSAGTAAAKAAPWAKPSDDDNKATSTPTLTPSSSMSLREIQAKEQKEAEIRKAAEKKAFAARIAAEEAAIAGRLAREAAESLPASSRWGDVASPAASAPAASPWAKASATAAPATTRSSTVKKTLKEIQEEEARQKKEAAAQAQARAKAYASSVGSASGSSLSMSVNAGGAWTTVGSGSKPAPAVAAPASIKPAVSGPMVVRAPSNTGAAPSMASRLAGSAIVAPKPASPAPVASMIKSISTVANGRAAIPISANKPEEAVAPASSDLIKWCRDALKGLEIPSKLMD